MANNAWQIPSSKHQITNNTKITISKVLNFGIGALVLFVIWNLLFGISAFAEDIPIVTTVSGGDAGLNLGYVREGTREVYNLQWQPDFKLGPFGLGLNV